MSQLGPTPRFQRFHERPESALPRRPPPPRLPAGVAPQPTFDQRNLRVSWGCGEPTFAASLPDGVVAPVLGAARASAHPDIPVDLYQVANGEMGGKHRSDRDAPAVA